MHQISQINFGVQRVIMKKQVLLLDIKHIKLVSVFKNYDAKLADLDATINELRHYQASSKLSDFSFQVI